MNRVVSQTYVEKPHHNKLGIRNIRIINKKPLPKKNLKTISFRGKGFDTKEHPADGTEKEEMWIRMDFVRKDRRSKLQKARLTNDVR